MWCREFVQDDMVQRDCYLLSLVRKGLSRKYLESGFSITVSGSGKKISQQEGPTQNERGMPEILREYGRNLLVINTLAGKAASPRPGQDMELSLCDGKPWEISVRSSMINGLTKKKKLRWATGWKLHSQSKHRDGALGYGTPNQTDDGVGRVLLSKSKNRWGKCHRRPRPENGPHFWMDGV